MSAIAPAEAYRAWAPSYERETAVSFLEDLAVRRIGPSPMGLRLLDAGCGTGRRLRRSGARTAVGIDLTFEMVREGMTVAPGTEAIDSVGVDADGTTASGDASGALDHVFAPRSRSVTFAVADCRSMPLPGRAFDLLWCRLMIGHVPDPEPLYLELARVCAPGGTIVVTDLHPVAARAGHRRTFRDPGGSLIEVQHHVHDVEDHIRWADLAGLEPIDRDDARVGPEIAPFYDEAGKRDVYSQQEGLPLVLVLSFRPVGS